MKDPLESAVDTLLGILDSADSTSLYFLQMVLEGHRFNDEKFKAEYEELLRKRISEPQCDIPFFKGDANCAGCKKQHAGGLPCQVHNKTEAQR